MKTHFAIGMTLMLVCLISSPARAEHHKSDKKPLRSVVLMPVQISLTRMSMKGAEPMMEEARDAELPLALEIEAALRNLGYQLDTQTLSPETTAKDTDERYTVDDLQKKYDTQLQLMRRKSKDVRKGRFTLGDEVVKLPLGETVDALLFARARGQSLTESKKAFGTFVAGARNDFTEMDFGLVDAKTGDVLYFAKSSALANLTEDSDEVAAGIARAFANLPKAASVPFVARLEAAPSSDSSIANNVPESQPRRIRLSQEAVKNLVIQRVAPQYPGIALSSHVQGDVVLRVVIDRNGQISSVSAVSGAVQLIPAATSAVMQWRYKPLTVNGQVFEVETQVVETFRFGP